MDLLTLQSGSDQIIEQDLIRLTRIISKWERDGIIDIDSGTIRDDFPKFMQGLEKTDDHKKAVEMVFGSCMVARLREAVRKKILDCVPENIAGILSGKDLSFVGPDTFLPNFIEQMRMYYRHFLEWKGS